MFSAAQVQTVLRVPAAVSGDIGELLPVVKSFDEFTTLLQQSNKSLLRKHGVKLPVLLEQVLPLCCGTVLLRAACEKWMC